jgi:anti-sigma B factor antagonist
MFMEITAAQYDQVTVVTAVGTIDAMTAGEVAAVLNKQLEDHHAQLVIDLSEVDYVSSAGIRVFLTTLRAARNAGGDLRLTGVQDPVQKVLDIAGVTELLAGYPDLESAVASFSS